MRLERVYFATKQGDGVLAYRELSMFLAKRQVSIAKGFTGITPSPRNGGQEQSRVAERREDLSERSFSTLTHCQVVIECVRHHGQL